MESSTFFFAPPEEKKEKFHFSLGYNALSVCIPLIFVDNALVSCRCMKNSFSHNIRKKNFFLNVLRISLAVFAFFPLCFPFIGSEQSIIFVSTPFFGSMSRKSPAYFA